MSLCYDFKNPNENPLKHTVNDIDTLIRRAKEDLSRNSLGEAEKNLEQAISINNQCAEVFYLLGLVQVNKSKFHKALTSFEKALALDPFHTEAAIALSSLFNDMGKYREGAKVFFKTKKRLHRTSPGHDPIINQTLSKKHAELAKLYLQYERFEEAYHEYEKALSLNPDEMNYAVHMARCLSRVNRRGDAINFLKTILTKNQKSVEARVQLGILYHAEQRLRDALNEWQEALSLDPENRSAQMYLSMLQSHSQTSQ